MSPVMSASRVSSLVGDFDRSPAYAGLAASLRLLIGDGRILLGTRLPSERELTEALGVSRTTVTRAYADLRDSGYAEARRGSGTFTTVPGGRRRALDNALLPYSGDENAIDLNCAAACAPPGVAAGFAAAAEELPAHLGGHGYFPAGLPLLQAAIAATYDARGLPTRPEQIMVTPGALTATAIVAQALTGPGDRVVVETPAYPNATQAIRLSGARIVASPVDLDGWDLAGVGATLRQTRPRLAYLIPDFHNPTGHLMTDAQREEYAEHLHATRTVAVVDEAHQQLALEGQEMPRPFATYAPGTISIGSASKAFWGGLRLGWIRASDEQIVRADPRPDRLRPRCARAGTARPDQAAGRPGVDPRRAAGPDARAARPPRRGGHRAPARVAVPPAGRWSGAVVRAASVRRHLGRRRGRTPRPHPRSRPRVRRRGRPRPFRAHPVDPPR